jgi:hypothetical protein
MKRLIIILALIGCTLTSALAQGTINFGNTVASRIRLGTGGSVSTATDGLIFGIFYGPAGSSESALTWAPGTATIGENTPGVLTGASSVFALPGTEAGQVVSLQVRAMDSAGRVLTSTDVRQVTLGPTAGPGTIIWQSSSGTNPNRFYPLVIPEPSSIAIGILGGMFLLFRLRHRPRKPD